MAKKPAKKSDQKPRPRKRGPGRPKGSRPKGPPRIPKKVLFREMLVKYIADPKNEFPTRTQMATEVCKTTVGNFYKHFNLEEMLEIEQEGFDLRQKARLRNLTQVYDAMEAAATGFEHDAVHISQFQGQVIETPITKKYKPDPAAASLLMDRLQGKVPSKTELTGKDGAPLGAGVLPIAALDLTLLDDDELALVEKIGMKLLKAKEDEEQGSSS